jgi:hypothetical protein
MRRRRRGKGMRKRKKGLRGTRNWTWREDGMR